MAEASTLPTLIAVSQHGRRLAQHVAGRLVEGPLREALEQAWRNSREIVFFGATGIAVRLIAPLLADKASDPAVVVVDDAGRHAISLVSGHEGGANDLARRVAAQLGAEAVLSTASEILSDRRLVLGIGCSSAARAEDIDKLVRSALAECGTSIESVSAIGTIDVKRSEPGLLEFADRWHLPLQFYPADELRVLPVPSPSATVEAVVGTPSVAEAAALLASGGELLLPKRRSTNVTVAIARRPSRGRLSVVGLGPGNAELLTPQAHEALREADVVVGYRLYTQMVQEWLPLASCDPSEIGQEAERVARAIALARAGRRVALVSSGDAGIYALAGLVFETLGDDSLDVEVLPGITAATSAAALLGAPLMSDFVVLSLSDLHVSADVIRKRLLAAAEADLVTVVYNPASQRRRQLLADAYAIFEGHRPSDTPVGLVRNAYRAGQSVRILSLGQLSLDEVDMFTVLVVGSTRTRVIGGRMVTSRA